MAQVKSAAALGPRSLIDFVPVPGFNIEEGERFSLLRAKGFASGHVHAFVVRGRGRSPLFRPGPVPREDICRALGLEAVPFHLPRQVHGARVVEVPRQDAGASQAGSADDAAPPEADAIFSRVAGHAVGVATADCLPILLASAGGAFAAVHAGWKGLVAGVVREAVQAILRTSTGTIEAAIGPAIGPCCFEVGNEVADIFRREFPQAQTLILPSSVHGKRFIALEVAARHALAAAGVATHLIRSTGLCTRCGGDRFESYRRDGARAGRMIALIARSTITDSPGSPPPR